ncbi:hypothetical protein DPEC_G00218110 [Dallia pectoralis]|uniref:Uncharacterized protein n=1 Tax=Dallia pectoralis TaxID=75939 RepID=A0ACC2G3B0_DALPE|nr:hypothetical protein DPEC_G00218110 [Dallia pectoralis]
MSCLLSELQDCKLFKTVHESEKTTTPSCTFSSTHCKANSTAINSAVNTARGSDSRRGMCWVLVSQCVSPAHVRWV